MLRILIDLVKISTSKQILNQSRPSLSKLLDLLMVLAAETHLAGQL
jgi:hypothetical protein